MQAGTSLSFGILGPLRIWRDGAPVQLGSHKQRIALARLLLADRPVSDDMLVDALWGDRPPPSTVSTLRSHISRLRSTLSGGGTSHALVHEPAGYRFAVPVEVDAWRFEQHVTAARSRREDATVARDLLAEGLELWRGSALEDFRYEPFAQPAIRRWEELRLTAVEDRAELDLQLGAAADLLAELEALAGEHPLRERLHALLILALYRSGRQADALAAYRRVREAHVSELGIEPSAHLRDLERAVLRQAAHLSQRGETVASQTPPPAQEPAPPFGSAWDVAVSSVQMPPLQERLRCELLLSRGRALRRAGRVEQSRHAFAAAVRLATAAGDAPQLAAAALGLAGPPEDTAPAEVLDEALVESAILELPSEHPIAAQLRARLAVALIDRGERDRGMQMMDKAIAAARACGDAEAVAYTLRALRRSWFDPAALDDRLAVSAELIDLGGRLGNDDILAWGHRWRSIDMIELGELDEFEAAVSALDAVPGTSDIVFHRWGVLMRRAGAALLRVPIPKAEAAVLEAVAFTEQVKSPYTTAAAMHLLWVCRWLQGRIGELETMIVELVEAMPEAAIHLPFLYAELDRGEEAAGALEQVTARGYEHVLEAGNRALHLLALGMLAETVAHLGDAARARELYTLAVPFAGRLVVVPPGITAITTVDHCLGRLAATLDDDDRAAAHFEDALRRCDEITAPVLAPRTQLAYSGLLRRRGDIPGADALTIEALKASARLGLAHPPALMPAREQPDR